ncbi:protein-glutamine gamma-glutamyltransferase [Cytobacillus spongiae]|jgi:protein-glutamine gamma-glutamyltransferase|uniref:protein-glutamine gamma-glutamyltransferase n=1 Tax=Cytobacillus spongiae TaxID=2901381 RepID=UPI001F2849A7|nr:protein-glutamine gamma-glutamyltransferase [Cytobacillus spongiae]UII57109.1 protein-glutamine gamma-glutamyltransferase [Cytobacillus spongiae]
MIRIQGKPIVEKPESLTVTQTVVYNSLLNSRYEYRYESVQQLWFELMVRENIMKFALELSRSNAQFQTFNGASFNPVYWIKTSKGFILQPNVHPSDAVRDIYRNSNLYGFECSTAIMVIYYNAVLASIPKRSFDYLFQNLIIWDWNYDSDLGMTTIVGDDFIPGDVVYFFNPDYELPVWTGENAVYLGDDSFFGHGIGVESSSGMIEKLNTLRKPNATETAYLLQQYTRLNFNYLSQFSSIEGI